MAIRPDAAGVARHHGAGRPALPDRGAPIDPALLARSHDLLVPGDSREEYGVFLGGQEIDSQRPPEYTAFVLRRDGQAAVLKRAAADLTAIVAWQAHEAIVPHKGGGEDPIKNVVRVEVGPAAVQMSVNGTAVAKVRARMSARMAASDSGSAAASTCTSAASTSPRGSPRCPRQRNKRARHRWLLRRADSVMALVRLARGLHRALLEELLAGQFAVDLRHL